MSKKAILRSMLTFPLMCSVAAAHCDLTEFDRLLPRAVVGHTDDGDFVFDWGTDIDNPYGTPWLVNFIANKHLTKGWSGYWEKGDIEVAVSNPLPAMKALCRQIPLKDCAHSLDTDAPIVYGLRNSTQRAAVFSEECNAEQAESVRYNVEMYSYIERENGEIADVSLDVSLQDKGSSTAQLSVSFSPPDLILGISKMTEALGEKALTEIVSSAEAEGTGVAIVEYSQYAAGGGQEVFNYSSEGAKADFVFFDKPFNAIANVSLKSFSSFVRSDIVLMDSKRRPIIRTSLDLPVLE